MNVRMTSEGWYPDPSGPPGTNRWWDGTAWTERTQVAPPPPPYLPPPVIPPLANYGARLGGWLLDWLIVGAISIPFLLLFHAIAHNTTFTSINGTATHGTNFHIGTKGILIQAVIVLVYGTLLCGSKRGQTIGMMAVGTRAADIATGAQIGYPRAFGRALFEYVLALALFIPWVIDMLFPLWDPMNQTLHDKATKTIVVKLSKDRPSAPVVAWPQPR
jgi:uncharacterized RDD family membrane protein YckC